jgi:5-methylcytosine-specific restriction endonuclease McrA
MQQQQQRKFLTPAQKQRLAAEQKYLCRECDILLPSTWQVDHVIPLHLGGTNEWQNLQILCPLCHANKSQLEAIEREALARQRKKKSPYFVATPAQADAPPPPPYILRRRCKAPVITLVYNEP